ncbi:hypothetical protein WG902_21340 [Ramlibacter sp. PS3R-8]|uniref:hypothetical protein n=1 Tax=Ramlibacter sp. PS3R-8 TaxID=3133437 RepID=UPI0030970ECD
MRRLWLLAWAAAAGAASAQNVCPHASEVRQAEMLGLWHAEFEDAKLSGTLVLEKHATYADSLSGTIERGTVRRPVSGEVEDGEFTLEESADGVRISGTWLGEVVEGSCGREIRGTWSVDGEGKDARAFVLRKQ